MRVIRCCEDGKICSGYKLEDDTLSDKGRIDVTNDCIIAIMKHLSCLESFLKDGFAGYQWNLNEGEGTIALALIDSRKYLIVDKGQFDVTPKEEAGNET